MDYHLLSDELLVKLLRVDDSDAFNEIYKRYWKILYQSARKKIASEDVVEEILQNVFLKIWEKRDIQKIDDLGAYLYTATKYQVMNYYRTQFFLEKFEPVSQNGTELLDDSTQQDIHLMEISHIFEQVLSLLPQKTSQVFALSRQELKTTREIAQILNIPERTVEYHITQSLKQLRISLKDFLPTIFIFLWLL
ncbi:RNA polymerase sigma factor [Dyadobacter tibetensis]|uniref:RNA polymerase sigma factor n=1 Tax=Dyadobacter tibetensis TaxID=1211851 RepID=UPI00046E5878|nr:sigma-70 family RNA polymerase sigma factor [Dyadobacter tibetensis]